MTLALAMVVTRRTWGWEERGGRRTEPKYWGRVARAAAAYEGRVVMREVGIQLIPDYLWRGRGFGQTSEPVPLMTAQDPWGTIAEHLEYGRFYNGPVGLMVNTGLPGTVCLLGVLAAGTVMAMRSLLYVRRHGAEDVVARLACANAAYWLMKVLIFIFIHGDSEYALNTFGLHLGIVIAVDQVLHLRSRLRVQPGGLPETASPAEAAAPVAAIPWWRRRPGRAAGSEVVLPVA